jgi:hypothetical protein
MLKNILAILILVSGTFFSLGQKSNCLNKSQLLKLHSTDSKDIESLLNKEGWFFNQTTLNETQFYFDYPFEYNTSTYIKTNYGYSKLVLYDYPEMPRIVIINTNRECFDNLRKEFANDLSVDNSRAGATIKNYQQGKLTVSFRQYLNNNDKQFSVLLYNSKIIDLEIKNYREKIALEREEEEKRLAKARAEEEKRLAKERAEQERKLRERNKLLFSADSLKQIYDFDGALEKLQSALELDGSEYVENLINEYIDARCRHSIDLADELYNHGEFQSAISAYQSITNCGDFSSEIQNKIKDSRDRIKENKINELSSEADKLYNSKQYSKALLKYNSILEIDSKNYSASNRKKEITDLLAFLELRKTKIYDYSTLKSNEFSGVKNELNQFVYRAIQNSPVGDLQFEYRICFDTLGTNMSNYSLRKSTIPEANRFLGDLSRTYSISAYKERGYFVNSSANIPFDCNWRSSQVNVRSRKNRMKFSDSELILPEIKKFIQLPNYKYGEFTFDVKTKNVNGMVSRDIYLSDYKTKAGPGNVMWSMILPGSGTLKVTHGQKGVGRMVWFLLLTGTSLLFDNASDYYYNLYSNATDQQAIQDNYKLANGYHHAFLFTGSIAVSIYVYDFFEVFGKGIKNEREARGLKQSRKSRIIIKEESILSH